MTPPFSDSLLSSTTSARPAEPRESFTSTMSSTDRKEETMFGETLFPSVARAMKQFIEESGVPCSPTSGRGAPTWWSTFGRG